MVGCTDQLKNTRVPGGWLINVFDGVNIELPTPAMVLFRMYLTYNSCVDVKEGGF